MKPPLDLNLNWVTDQLAVGGRFEMDACRVLSGELGIRRVVDLRVETVDDREVLLQHGIELLHLPTVDVTAVSQPMLEEGVAWVNAQLNEGHRVYIHCEHGIGRSALLTLCVLASRGHAPMDAMKTLKRARSVVSPSEDQMKAFIHFCEHRLGLQRPSLRDLLWIGWAHLRNEEG